jgi:hypothetical protein
MFNLFKTVKIKTPEGHTCTVAAPDQPLYTPAQALKDTEAVQQALKNNQELPVPEEFMLQALSVVEYNIIPNIKKEAANGEYMTIYREQATSPLGRAIIKTLQNLGWTAYRSELSGDIAVSWKAHND